MGKRREPRKAIEVPVRIFGTDCDEQIFSENVTTMDVSQNGTRLTGIKARLKLEEVIGLAVDKNKVNFRVKWQGAPGSPLENQVGLLNLAPTKPLWDFPVPRGAADNFRITIERRKSPRVKCSISVELHPQEQPVIWGKAADLSVGGCFVEMPIPLTLNTKFEIALWLQETKLRLQGEVASVAPGFGIGVRFIGVSPESEKALRQHAEAIAGVVGPKHFEA